MVASSCSSYFFFFFWVNLMQDWRGEKWKYSWSLKWTIKSVHELIDKVMGRQLKLMPGGPSRKAKMGSIPQTRALCRISDSQTTRQECVDRHRRPTNSANFLSFLKYALKRHSLTLYIILKIYLWSSLF